MYHILRSSKLWLVLLCVSIVLGACNRAAPPPSSGMEASQRAVSQPVQRATPVPTKLPTPVLPTAVPPTPPPIVPGSYVNKEYGVSLEYPKYWRKLSEGEQSILLELASADGNGVIALVSPIQSSQTLEAASRDIRERLIYDDQAGRYSTNEAITRADGRTAWLTEYATAYGYGTLQLRQLSVAQRGWLVTVMTYGDVNAFALERQELLQVEASLTLSEPEIFGIPRDQALVYVGSESTNPRDYDPAHGGGSDLVFSGLVSLNPQLDVVPDLAESWDVSDNGLVYTFQLRENARFHDGKRVTAADVAYSWERAADPATGSDVVLTHLGDIVGVREKKAGQTATISGVEVLDDRLLRVTLDAPKPYFLLKLTTRAAAVVDQANVEGGANWYRTPNGTGPYRLVRWNDFEFQVYERFAEFYLEPPPTQYVIVKSFAGLSMQLYEVGDVDLAQISAYDFDRVRNAAEPLRADLREGIAMCTSFITFDTTQPPFDDPLVRQAFTRAIDKQRYLDVGLDNQAMLARGLYPPGLAGYNAELPGLDFDPELARQQLAESQYGGLDGLPPLTFTSYGHGNRIDNSVAALIDMWQTNLGVAMTTENLDPNRAEEMIYDGAHGQLVFWHWCADYPDPENFANTLFRSAAQQNIGGYANPELDALLAAADVERDPAQRVAFYQQAEQIIVADAAAIFLSHDLNYVLVKPYVEGYTLTPVDVPIERYLTLRPGE